MVVVLKGKSGGEEIEMGRGRGHTKQLRVPPVAPCALLRIYRDLRWKRHTFKMQRKEMRENEDNVEIRMK